MKPLLLLAITVATLAGCAAEEPISIGSTTSQGSDQQKDEVVESLEKTKDLEEAEEEQDIDKLEPVRESALVITKRLVESGFTPAARTAREIDTVIIHSVYNPFSDAKKHDLGEILGIFEGYGVAPHYIITRDGQVHQVVETKDIAYHAGRSQAPDGRTDINNFSLGIELINSLDDTYTDEQYAALNLLLEKLDETYGITYVLGHDEIEVEDPWNFKWEEINTFRDEPRTAEGDQPIKNKAEAL